MKGKAYPCGCRRKNGTPPNVIGFLHLCDEHQPKQCQACGFATWGPSEASSIDFTDCWETDNLEHDWQPL